MTFADILDNVGGMGRFQRMMVSFLAIPLLMLASHNLLQNFTAGIPQHHCQIRIASNTTRQGNGTMGNLGADQLLRISIPTDTNRRPEQCRRFAAPQWRFLDLNATLSNGTVFDTEACEDGWTYDRSLFSNTIVSEMGVAGAGTAFAPNFTIYCILRFLCGMAMSGISLNSLAMAFAELLDQVGGMGRFQGFNVALLCFPMLLMAAHNLLQNFTAAVPGHHCRVTLNKVCADGNATGNRDCRALLRAFVPQDGAWKPEKCWRFVTPQWQLLEFNSTGREPTEAEQEPCLDGWTYEGSVFTSTIVTEWDLVCNFRSLQQLAQSIYMAGVLIRAEGFASLVVFPDGGVRILHSVRPQLQRLFCGVDADAFSSHGQHGDRVQLQPWAVHPRGRSVRHPGLALAPVGRVPPLLLLFPLRLVLKASLQTDNSSANNTKFPVADLVRTTSLRRVTVCLCFVCFAYYGLAMDLQNFGVSVYLIQVIFGAIDIPAKLVAFLVISYSGRRIAQALSLILAGLSIAGNIFVSHGCLGASFNCVFLYTGELYPTANRDGLWKHHGTCRGDCCPSGEDDQRVFSIPSPCHLCHGPHHLRDGCLFPARDFKCAATRYNRRRGDQIGGMGRFQILQVTLLVTPILLTASHNLLQNFSAGIPDHHCRVRLAHNGTYAHTNWTQMPTGEEDPWGIPKDASGQPEKCLRFVATEWPPLNTSAEVGGNSTGMATEPCKDGWVYDRSIFTNTIIMEWDLVCNRKTRRQMAQSIYMGGVLAGALILGSLADRFGRKAILTWSYLQLAVSGVCTAFAPNYAAYCAFRWFAESARWLVLSGKADQAVDVLKKVAQLNGKKDEGEKLNTEVRRVDQNQMEISLEVQHAEGNDFGPVIQAGPKTDSFPGFRFATSFAYYGLAMDLQHFGFSIYLIQVAFGTIDIPAKLGSAIGMSYIGRRTTQASSVILAGLAILVNILVPSDLRTLRTFLAVLGKGCLASSFNCLYLYTGELYPTVIRQTGMGLGSTLARVGGIVAPMIKMTGEHCSYLPSLIYGTAPILSGIAAVFLPETLNVPLPDTIDEVEGR
ncbi:Solute carrier family 22 member 6-B, partial [Ophiophagus hannah]